MTISDLLTPWLLLAAVLIPFTFAEKWIHSHLYGVGWLLTNENKSATALYYLILLPGVFVHEFVQWLVAGALNVQTKRVMAWPEAQKDGTLRLDFVQIRKADWAKSAIIGAAPLIVGVTLVWTISNRILNLEAFLTALGTGEISEIGSTIQDLGRTADFYLWLYLMFAISNAMIPTPSDRKGWPLLIGIFAVCLAFLVLIGVGDVLMETFTGPVAHTLNILTTALATVLMVELLAILSIGFFEEILERLTKRKFVYSTPTHHPSTSEARQPGSNLPLPPGAPMPSIYNLKLPIPDSSIQNTLTAKAKRQADRPETSPGRIGMPERAAPARMGDEERPLATGVRPAGFARPSPELPDEEEKITSLEPSPGLRRSSPGPLERPGTISRPGAPGFGASRMSPIEDEDTGEEVPVDDDQPIGFPRSSPPGVPSRPGTFSRPGAPGFGASRTSPADEEITEDDDMSEDEPPAGFRRPPGSVGSKNRPFVAPIEYADDVDEDDGDKDEDDVEYVDFDDL